MDAVSGGFGPADAPCDIELLAPAGNMECLQAAVSAGANAVYVGADAFNARRGAENFTMEALRRGCAYAHLRGVKIYLTLNIIVLPSELDDALELARQAWLAGVDAFIVQDIGIMAELARVLPEAEVHASTQNNIHNEDGLRAMAALGATRVTLARELSLSAIEQLAGVARKLGIELEVFGHGALCICYSGQCFMSSMVGGRSANRGQCAQACRLPYTLYNKAQRKALKAPGEHLLSPKDLSTIDMLPQLIGAGVASLKIEGRMKSADYVYAVVSTYRSVLNRAGAWLEEARMAEQDCGAVELGVGKPIQPRSTAAEQQMLSEAFSRGFTTAYLENKRGNEIMSYGRPNNRGVFIGRVTSVSNGRVTLQSETELHVGDVIEFWTNRGHFTHVITELKTASGGAISLVPHQAVGKGDRVFRVRNHEAAFEGSELEPKIGVTGALELNLGQPARLQLQAKVAGVVYTVQVEGAMVEAARTKALTEEEAREHVGRMGSTPFVLNKLTVQLSAGIGMGFSALHKLRAQACDALQEQILAGYTQRSLQKTPRRSIARPRRRNACSVVVLATNPACARAAKKAGAEAIYVPVHNYRRGAALIAGQLSQTAEQAGYPKQCIPVLPVVDGMFDAKRPGGFDPYGRVAPGKPVLVEGIGQLLRAAELQAAPEVGPHLPVSNYASLQVVESLGACRVWLSPELSLTQIEELGQVSAVPLGLTIMGQAELMVTEHCVLMSQGPCDQRCTTCSRRKSPHYLKDRKGYEMPVITDSLGRSHLYNAVALDIAHLAPELISAGVSAFMVDTTHMTVAETSKNVARAVRARDIAIKSGDHVSKTPDTTTGHIFRGVS